MGRGGARWCELAWSKKHAFRPRWRRTGRSLNNNAPLAEIGMAFESAPHLSPGALCPIGPTLDVFTLDTSETVGHVGWLATPGQATIVLNYDCGI